MLERACIKDGSSKAESDRELAEAQISLGRLQNELSEKIRQVAEYDSELQKHKELFQSAEVDRNRLVIQHNSDQNEVLQLIGGVNELETRVRDNNTRVEGPDDGHFIVKRAHVEIQTAQNEARIVHEELDTARSISNEKIEQITAERAVALDQSKTVMNSLKSEVNLLTRNAKVDSNVTVNIVPDKKGLRLGRRYSHRRVRDTKPLLILPLGLCLPAAPRLLGRCSHHSRPSLML